MERERKPAKISEEKLNSTEQPDSRNKEDDSSESSSEEEFAGSEDLLNKKLNISGKEHLFTRNLLADLPLFFTAQKCLPDKKDEDKESSSSSEEDLDDDFLSKKLSLIAPTKPLEKVESKGEPEKPRRLEMSGSSGSEEEGESLVMKKLSLNLGTSFAKVY